MLTRMVDGDEHPPPYCIRNAEFESTVPDDRFETKCGLEEGECTEEWGIKNLFR